MRTPHVLGTLTFVGFSTLTAAAGWAQAPASSPPPVVAAQPAAAAPARHLPVYAQFMFLGGALVEDGDHRLTTRDSRTLEGVGGVLRVGGYLSERHRLGLRAQSFTRPTKKVARDTPADPTASPWGAVVTAHVGPEYMYLSDRGFYAAGSLGGGVAVSAVDRGDCTTGSACTNLHGWDPDHKDDMERASGGVSAIASAGYEWRLHRFFTMNAELFTAAYQGFDDDENTLTNLSYGVALGVGF